MDAIWLQHVLMAGPAILYSVRLMGETTLDPWHSDNVERILGYSKDESLRPDWWPTNVHPADLAALEAQQPTIESQAHSVLEYRFRHKNGEYLWIRDEQNRYPQEDGTTLLVGSWSDITERKRAEERLQQSQALLAEAEQIAQLGSWEWDMATDRVTWSAGHYDICGVEPGDGDLEGADFFSLLHPEDRAALERTVAGTMTSGEAFAADLRLMHSSKGERHVQVRGKLVRDAAGNPIRTVGTLQDVTESRLIENAVRMAASATEAAYTELSRKHEELKAAQGQLIQAGKMAAIGTLVAGLSHELNNPIGIILGYTQSLLKRTPVGDPAHQALSTIERQAQRCCQLVKSLLDFSRKRSPQREPLLPEALLERITSLVSLQADQRGLRFDVTAGTDLPAIFVSRVEIESAMLNIICNAMDATPAGGRIDLQVAVADHGVQLRVADTGSGIPADLLPMIFDPFFTTKPEGKGTGLGLSLASQLIEANGGRIEVDSTVGEDTTMCVWLPAHEAGPAPSLEGAKAFHPVPGRQHP